LGEATPILGPLIGEKQNSATGKDLRPIHRHAGHRERKARAEAESQKRALRTEKEKGVDQRVDNIINRGLARENYFLILVLQ